MTEDSSTVRWTLSGRVQGVGFRWFTARRAHSLDLAGWVANLPDGRVVIVAKGTKAHLQSLEEAIRRGPSGANVESVEKSDIPRDLVPGNAFEIK
ncbi:MAG: acylphosphatase [Gemmatimonadetes bacterium]|nr:acylphosphatase [Gemmatimonadota bacterium]